MIHRPEYFDKLLQDN